MFGEFRIGCSHTSYRTINEGAFIAQIHSPSLKKQLSSTAVDWCKIFIGKEEKRTTTNKPATNAQNTSSSKRGCYKSLWGGVRIGAQEISEKLVFDRFEFVLRSTHKAHACQFPTKKRTQFALDLVRNTNYVKIINISVSSHLLFVLFAHLGSICSLLLGVVSLIL